ncbi:acyl-CoA thioesterase [Treponema brennaborense]|uniref:4-hydroxybenzoyl-CoA thioesterase n=1 Tax=Treponema brennaborense (strain DSM 12168 / CIP 105900 / DD5/3) TaxID=906968 RepID=F4LPF0_TREBD|nr:thioesterase family protein [Treponema brennaborense]AEE15961.1 4-hydroxybenzoyl-CoA thioesterase [Treponema brennaborense DSM 12168]
MKHIAKLVVRSYECDSYGHVNNAVYLNYLEYGRMEFLHAVRFDYNGIVAAGYYLYVTHVDIHYKASAFLDDELFIEVYPSKMKAVSGTFRQTIRKADGTVCAEADVTWACVTTAGRPAKLPAEFMVEGLQPDASA